MQSNYPFLARNQKTEEQRQKENIDALWNRLGTMGVTGNRSFFTGYGNDGKLQPDRPTAILNTNEGPRTIHEGEQLDVGADGGFSVTPASQVGGQEKLMEKESQLGMKGYQFGTPDKQTDYTYTSTTDDTYKPVTTRGLQRLERYADTTSPMDKSIMGAERERFAGEAASARGALSQELAQGGVTGREAATEQVRLGRQIGAQESQLMQGLRKQQSDKAFAAAQQLPGAASTARTEERLRESLGFAKEQFREQMDFEKEKYGDAEFVRMADDAQTTSLETWLAKYPNATEEDYNVAREYKSRQLAGMDIELETAGENLTQLKDSRYWDQAQQFLNAKDFTNYAALVKQITGRDVDVTQFQKDLDAWNKSRLLEIDAATIANDAAQLGVDSARLSSFVQAINSGSTLDAANDASGLNLTWTDWALMRRNYDYEGQVQSTTIDRLLQENDNYTFNSIMYQINSGATLDRINTDFGRNFTEEEFAAMRDTTATGVREWENSLEAAGMLLQTGDPDNIMEARGVLEDLFPGVTWDMRTTIEDVGAARFAEGLKDMATLANTYSTWDEARSSVSGLRLSDRMEGVGNTQLEELFDALKINIVDEEWNTFKQSEFFKGLPEDSQNLITDFITAKYTGELEYDIEPSYQILDEKGRFVTEFASVEDANDYLDKNKGKNYSMEEGKNWIWKDLIGGDSITINNQGDVVNAENQPLASAWDTFEATIPTGVLDSPDYDPDAMYNQWLQWKDTNEGKNTYDEMLAGQGGDIVKLNSMNLTGEQLLKGTNSDLLLSAWKQDPEAIRGSKYFYDLSNPVKLLSDNTDEHIGHMTELREGDTTYVGQIQSFDKQGDTVDVKIKLPSGAIKTIRAVSATYGDITPSDKI